MRKRAVPPVAIMIIPALLCWLLSFGVPIVVAGRLSLFQSNYIVTKYVGLQNYRDAFTDVFFKKSFMNAFALMLMTIPFLTVVTYWVTLAISDFRLSTQSTFRFALYLPNLAAGIVMTLIWRWFLVTDGLINQVLGAVGLSSVRWLHDAWPARASISLILIAGGIGSEVLLLSASLCAIPKELHDAAVVDGATRRQYHRRVVLPLLIPTISLLVLLNIIGAMQVWETIYVLFQHGGPEGAAATPVYEIFMTAFLFSKRGLASSKGILLMVVIAVIIAAKQRVEKWAE